MLRPPRSDAFDQQFCRTPEVVAFLKQL